MEGFLPRQLVRTKSLDLPRQNSNVVIGVTVAEATVEIPDLEDEEVHTPAVCVSESSHKMRSRRATLPSQQVFAGVPKSGGGWKTKAKELARKLGIKDEQ